MNVKLRTEMLARLWQHLQGPTDAPLTEQYLYGVPATSQISLIYSVTAFRFLEKTLPWVSAVIDNETRQTSYDLPPRDECISHLIHHTLMVNRTTFVRFFVAVYCVQDGDNALSTMELWGAMLNWARQHNVAVAYLPVTGHSLTTELEMLGYVKCRVANGTGFWGLKLVD